MVHERRLASRVPSSFCVRLSCKSVSIKEDWVRTVSHLSSPHTLASMLLGLPSILDVTQSSKPFTSINKKTCRTLSCGKLETCRWGNDRSRQKDLILGLCVVSRYPETLSHIIGFLRLTLRIKKHDTYVKWKEWGERPNRSPENHQVALSRFFLQIKATATSISVGRLQEKHCAAWFIVPPH